VWTNAKKKLMTSPHVALTNRSGYVVYVGSTASE
jgi:hypothetical protein